MKNTLYNALRRNFTSILNKKKVKELFKNVTMPGFELIVERKELDSNG